MLCALCAEAAIYRAKSSNVFIATFSSNLNVNGCSTLARSTLSERVFYCIIYYIYIYVCAWFSCVYLQLIEFTKVCWNRTGAMRPDSPWDSVLKCRGGPPPPCRLYRGGLLVCWCWSAVGRSAECERQHLCPSWYLTAGVHFTCQFPSVVPRPSRKKW